MLPFYSSFVVAKGASQSFKTKMDFLILLFLLMRISYLLILIALRVLIASMVNYAISPILITVSKWMTFCHLPIVKWAFCWNEKPGWIRTKHTQQKTSDQNFSKLKNQMNDFVFQGDVNSLQKTHLHASDYHIEDKNSGDREGGAYIPANLWKKKVVRTKFATCITTTQGNAPAMH